MTDNEIIKFIEYAINSAKSEDGFKEIYWKKLDYILDLINRQKAEIEELKDILEKVPTNAYDLQVEASEKLENQIKSEAIKEFAERVKKELRLDDDCSYDCENCCFECKEFVPQIDNLVKEMTAVKMRKVFISQPMKGKSDGEIKAVRENLIKKIKERFGEVEIMDTYLENAPYDARPLWYLTKSLEILSRSDIAYFAKDFDKNRGCTIEHLCAREYGITIVYEEVRENDRA